MEFGFTEENGEYTPEFRLAPLFMTDRTGAASSDISYSLTALGKDEYMLTIEPDSDWINSSERIFPVKIDPTIEYLTSQITNITSVSYSSNYDYLGGMFEQYRKIGYDEQDNEYISYFKVSTEPIPKGYEVNQAYMKIFTSESRGILLDVYPLDINWSFEYPYFYDTDQNAIARGIHGGGYETRIDVTSAYARWARNPSENYGFLVKSYYNCCDSCSDVWQFYSEESEYPPVFVVEYRASAENRKFRPEHETIEIDMGIAGNTKVDLFNGGVIIQTPDIKTKDGKTVPMTSLLFNNDAVERSSVVKDKWKTIRDFKLELKHDNKLNTDFIKYTDILENLTILDNKYPSANLFYTLDGLSCLQTSEKDPVHNTDISVFRFTDASGNMWKITPECYFYTAKTGEVYKYRKVFAFFQHFGPLGSPQMIFQNIFPVLSMNDSTFIYHNLGRIPFTKRLGILRYSRNHIVKRSRLAVVVLSQFSIRMIGIVQHLIFRSGNINRLQHFVTVFVGRSHLLSQIKDTGVTAF